MESKNKSEMEQIQRGLEAFLEKELEGAGTEGDEQNGDGRGGSFGGSSEELHIIGQPSRRERLRGSWHGEAEGEPYTEDWDDGHEESFRRRGRGYEEYEEEEAPPRRRRQAYEEYEEEEIPPRRRRQTYERSRQGEVPSRRKEPPREKRQSGKKRGFREEEQSWEKEEPPVSKRSKKAQKDQKKRRKKKSRFKKFLLAAALVVVLLGAGLYGIVGMMYAKMTYNDIPSVASAPMKEDGVVNILLIGNDSRENGEDGRSDAMILLSISSRTKTIYMTSLLRDMYVDIPGHDGNRLNAAYSFGGAELLMETVSQNFDIPVNRYMLVNFEAFANLVDAVNGIDLELSKGEIEYVNGYLWEYNMLTGREDGTDNMDPSVAENGPALVHLNGPQALAYSRNRYIGTDFGRTERQRKVLTEVIHKLPGAMLTNAGGLVDGLMPNLTTNLTKDECFRLSLMAGKLLTYDIVSDSIPQPNTYRDVTIRKMEVLEVDFDANIRYLKEKIYGEGGE